jgi:hypothetical protein
MFRKGHRLFSIASIGLILVALLHAITHFSSPSDDLVMSALWTAMQAYRFDLGLGSPSMMDIYQSMSLTMAIVLAWVGLANLLIARYTGLRDKLMRRVCTLNIVGVGALVLLFSIYQLPAPALGLGIVDILFFIARFRLRRSRIIH